MSIGREKNQNNGTLICLIRYSWISTQEIHYMLITFAILIFCLKELLFHYQTKFVWLSKCILISLRLPCAQSSYIYVSVFTESDVYMSPQDLGTSYYYFHVKCFGHRLCFTVEQQTFNSRPTFHLQCDNICGHFARLWLFFLIFIKYCNTFKIGFNTLISKLRKRPIALAPNTSKHWKSNVINVVRLVIPYNVGQRWLTSCTRGKCSPRGSIMRLPNGAKNKGNKKKKLTNSGKVIKIWSFWLLICWQTSVSISTAS